MNKRLYINAEENIDIEALLLMIFNVLLGYYNRGFGYPKEIQLTSSNYLLIQEKRKDVIMKEDNDYFILGMKIVICG